MTNRIGVVGLIAAVALGLTSCARGPSDEELADAVRTGHLQRVVELSGTTSRAPGRIDCLTEVIRASDLSREERQAIADGDDAVFDNNEENDTNLDLVRDEIRDRCLA